jgi:hypothetical protein
VRVALSQHYRTVKVKRTATVKGTDSPNFSECFNFRIPAAQIDVTSISFQVLQAVSGYSRGESPRQPATVPSIVRIEIWKMLLTVEYIL